MLIEYFLIFLSSGLCFYAIYGRKWFAKNKFQNVNRVEGADEDRKNKRLPIIGEQILCVHFCGIKAYGNF